MGGRIRGRNERTMGAECLRVPVNPSPSKQSPSPRASINYPNPLWPPLEEAAGVVDPAIAMPASPGGGAAPGGGNADAQDVAPCPAIPCGHVREEDRGPFINCVRAGTRSGP
ncbi:hypothetical protein KM043_013755 [Ampulex compressa]|nr:hypothetical protein KM043_013755 [Ampulex compressa]